jgi:hypothetical protein
VPSNWEYQSVTPSVAMATIDEGVVVTRVVPSPPDFETRRSVSPVE